MENRMFSLKNLRWICILIGALHLIACGKALDPAEYSSVSIDGVDLSVGQSEVPIAFSLVRTGASVSLDAFAYRGGSWSEAREFVFSAVLVRHPKGDFLFDTGLGREIDAQYEDMPQYLRPLTAYTGANPLIDQIVEHGIDPGTIGTILLSHLHWDHASGIEDFPNARVLLPKSEHEIAMDPKGAMGYLKSQLDSETIIWSYLEFVDQPYLNFDRSHDLYSDGSVILVPMHGHTRGSMGMFLNFPDGRRYLFSGDTTWTIEGFRKPAEKFLFARKLVKENGGKTRKEVVRVHRLMQALPDLVVIPAHDANIQGSIGYFPHFVE